MDQRLHDLWRKGEYPFDQPVITPEPLLDTRILLEFTRAIVGYLKPRFELKYLNRDWHMHDGYIKESDEIDWQGYEEILVDEYTFRIRQDPDDVVCLTVYPENLGFILRTHLDWNVPSLPNETWEQYFAKVNRGDFDLTIDAAYVEDILSLIEPFGVPMVRHLSKGYFDRRYGGKQRELLGGQD